MKRVIFILSLALFTLLQVNGLQAQSDEKGIVRGKITDATSGEAMMFTTVFIKDSDPLVGTETDLDGNYELQVVAGTHTLSVSYVGYRTATITDVEVTAGKVTLINLLMEEDN